VRETQRVDELVALTCVGEGPLTGIFYTLQERNRVSLVAKSAKSGLRSHDTNLCVRHELTTTPAGKTLIEDDLFKIILVRFRGTQRRGFTTCYTAAVEYDDKVRTLADWNEGWEPIRALESQITEVWNTLKDLRAKVAERKALLFQSCPQELTELEVRFWSKVNIIDDDDSCWEWTAGRRPVQGEEYGLFRIFNDRKNPDGKSTIGAHRMALMLSQGGAIPDHARHKCDNPPCCRPSHLENGTHADNMRDKSKRGRARGKTNQRGEANDSAVLTDAIVLDARTRSKAGETQASIAAHHNVQIAVLGYAIRGQTWQHLDEIEAPHVRRQGGGSRLIDNDIRIIRARYASGDLTDDIAHAYGMSAANVSAIVRRKSWKHVE
jgi:hypothetical protein